MDKITSYSFFLFHAPPSRFYSQHAGVFPNLNDATNSTYVPSHPQIVPVYTTADRDDFLIRAYTKCPAYKKKLVDWCVRRKRGEAGAQGRGMLSTSQTLPCGIPGSPSTILKRFV